MLQKADYVYKMFDLMEMIGEVTLLHEFVAYASTDELKEFVEHCETMFEVETP